MGASTSFRTQLPGASSSSSSYHYYLHVCVPADEMQMCRHPLTLTYPCLSHCQSHRLAD